MAFKMKGSSLYGKVNLNRGGNANKPDGRAKSSAFQDTKTGAKKYSGQTVAKGDANYGREEGQKYVSDEWAKQESHNDAHKTEKRDAEKPGAPKKTDPTDKPDMDKQQNIANPDGGTWKGSGSPKTYKSLQSDGTYKVLTNKSGSESKSDEDLKLTHVTKEQQAKNRADYVEQQNKKASDKRNNKQKRKEGRKKLLSKVKGIFTGKRKRQQDYENLLDQE